MPSNITDQGRIRELEEELAAERRHRKELESDRNLLRALIESMADEVWYFDRGGRLKLLNQAVHKFLGFNTFPDHPKPLPELLAELEIRNPDGSPRSE